ncbi:MAG TPA: DinB family protein [Fimbriimonadaceae bacterium]|nr:DinB family protein [Fimbriimonadaceae bacterium]
MADVHQLLKARFAMVRQDLDEAIERFSEDQFGWAPAAGMRTVGGQLLEIADKDRETVIWMKTGIWPDDEPPSFDLETSSFGHARSALESIRAKTLAYLDSMTAAELEMPVFSPERWHEALRLTECPRSEVLRNIAAHEWYHTAQLVTYRWLLGDDPELW